MDNTNITPQGYTYAIAPNTTHPFWKDGSGDSNYIYAPLKNPVVFENTDKNFTRFDVTLEGDVPFIAPLTLSLVSVTINSEVALPFVGVSHGDVAFLICEGIETNRLKVVGVYATTDMSALEIKHVISIPAPIKGDKGDNGQDGVTPQITATATVDQTTGNATVNVTKTGTDTNPAFNFAFTGLKGERGERGEQGQAGANGNDGATGATGATPDITVNATVDETTGTPAVDVTKSGTPENPVFDLAFSGLKGEGGGGGEWHRVFCSSGEALGQLLTTLKDSGINDCYINFQFNVGATGILLTNNFVAYKPYDGTTESFTLDNLGYTSIPSLRGVHYCLEKRQMGDNVMYNWLAVQYQYDGHVAELHNQDSTKQLTLPMTIDSPYISQTMTQFNTVTGRMATQGGSCYLQNSGNYASFIISVTNIAIDLLPANAEVYYRG